MSVVEASAGTGGAAGIKASDAEDTGLEAVVGEFEPRFVVAQDDLPFLRVSFLLHSRILSTCSAQIKSDC